MLVSAVVLSFNAEAHIRQCIEALVATFGQLNGECEIFVIENGSHDDSPQMLRELESEHGSMLDVTYLDSNSGTTKSRNLAIRRARGEFVLILDADALANTEAVKRLIDVLRENDDYGIAVPKLVYPNGNFQLSVDKFPTVQRKLWRAFRLKQLEQNAKDCAPSSDVIDVDYAISAFWLVRREIFDRVGLLDERIFYSPEDVDFCLRVWKAGWRVAYDSSVTAIHDAQELSRGRKFSAFKIRHVKGLADYFFKHRYLFSTRRFAE